MTTPVSKNVIAVHTNIISQTLALLQLHSTCTVDIFEYKYQQLIQFSLINLSELIQNNSWNNHVVQN